MKSKLNFASIIKERVSSREMLQSVGIHVDMRGMSKCPFHGDKDASLKVYDDIRRGWHCYGCHAGGDVIDFAVMWYGVSFKEAMSKINGAFSLGLPIDDRAEKTDVEAYRKEIEEQKRKREAKQHALDEAENAYWTAYERWLKNESIIASERPQGPFSAMSEAFIYAITHSAEIRDNLNLAEERWWKCRAERHSG